MIDQNFGTKELYDVIFRARAPMQFGERFVEKDEIITVFDNINVSLIQEQDRPIAAKGGWGNMPHVIWEDRSEVSFSFSQGVLSNIGFAMLTSSRMLRKISGGKIISMHEIFDSFEDINSGVTLQYQPILNKPIFCYEYERGIIQKKINFEYDANTNKIIPSEPLDSDKGMFVDYFFNFDGDAITYLIEKERFNGIFTLEGKFYTKDENDGLNVTNIITMPKVRILSSLNLRMGERADPTVSTFNVIAMPEKTENSSYELLNIVKLDRDID